MKVKATNDFNFYRLQCLEGITYEQFRELQQGKVVDVDKKVYENNKHIFEVVGPPKKEVKDGD